jgi:hypothetical protein
VHSCELVIGHGLAPTRRRRGSFARWPVIDDVALGPANRVKNASRLAAALPSSPCLRSLRPILAEHDPDDDHRAGCDHHRADHRQLFEDSENCCPPPMVSREAQACHTHLETPFGPSSEFLTTRSSSPAICQFGCHLRPHRPRALAAVLQRAQYRRFEAEVLCLNCNSRFFKYDCKMAVDGSLLGSGTCKSKLAPGRSILAIGDAVCCGA